MFVAACFWAAGFLVGALGIATEQLWLLYLGYGVIGGIGLGIGYISPVSTLIKWFPDRPGLATGLAIMGFGGGALVASPLSRQLLAFYDTGYDPNDATSRRQRPRPGGAVRHPRHRLLRRDDVRRVANVRVPADGLAARRASTRRRVEAKPMVTTASVSAANAIKTPQFWLLWVVLFCNVTAGIGILEQASPMIQDFFRDETARSTRRGRGGRRVRRACCRCSTWPAGSSGRRPPTSSAASRSTWSTSASAWCSTRCWPSSGTPPRRCSCCSPASSSRSTAAGSRPCRRTCATCSAPSRSARSTAGCSPPGRPPASPDR